ncbi:ABC transporter permease [Natronorubrum tibetense]|uniref:Uncharacterized protein n=1 Tax=Natronorubrum tibetense GA33 TaxID=1114856 RepID=L9VL64_9EURY|nr:ABC transporter permease [Natronorubrum tibetense]ELY37816.1 hypothetical protein C496_19980 [Natronorubrum tibetense GA33]
MAIVGIAVAVLAMTLLAGGGLGVMEVGEQQFDSADRDLWVTGGPVGLTPAGGGGFENTLHDSHEVAAQIDDHEEVSNAVSMSFQTVYISENGTSYDTIIGTGVTGGGGAGGAVSISDGRGFSGNDDHYANGSFGGEMGHEVVIDERTADAYDLSINDTVHLGGTTSAADDNEFTVVGISSTFSEFLGTPTVTVRLSELQTITGSTGTDPASMITITLEDEANPEAVQANLQEEYPEYEVRTNQEQLESVVGEQATVLVGAGLLVGVALITGTVLTVSMLALFVYHHRAELATLTALGIARPTIAGVVIAQGFFLGLAGWLFGVTLTVPFAYLLNTIVESIVGFDGLVIISPMVIAGSGILAIGIGSIAALVVGWRLPSTSDLGSNR